MEYTVRTGARDDLEAVYNLVEELAIYEKEPNALTASLAQYKTDYDQNMFEFLVAEMGNSIVGMALYYMTYSTWKGRMLYLEDFYVRDKYRRNGIGQCLFEAFLDTAREQNCVLVKWQVLDWNEPALSFYKKYDAEIETNWYNGKLYLD